MSMAILLFHFHFTSPFCLLLFVCFCRLGTIWGNVCCVCSLTVKTQIVVSQTASSFAFTLCCGSQQLCWAGNESRIYSRDYRSMWMLEHLISVWLLSSNRCLGHPRLEKRWKTVVVFTGCHRPRLTLSVRHLNPSMALDLCDLHPLPQGRLDQVSGVLGEVDVKFDFLKSSIKWGGWVPSK